MSHKLHTHRPYFQGRVQGPADTPKTLTHITHTDPIFRVVFRALRTHYMSHTLQIKILVSGLCSGPGGHTTNCHTHYTHGPYFQGCVQGAADTPHITHIANTDPSFRVVFRALRTHQKLLHKLHTRNLFSGWCSGRCGHTTSHTHTLHTQTLVSGLCSGRCGHTTNCHTHCTHGPYFQGRVQGPADTRKLSNTLHTHTLISGSFSGPCRHTKNCHKHCTHRP